MRPILLQSGMNRPSICQLYRAAMHHDLVGSEIPVGGKLKEWEEASDCLAKFVSWLDDLNSIRFGRYTAQGPTRQLRASSHRSSWL